MDDSHFRIRPHVSVIAHSPDEVELRQGVWNPVSMNFADEERSGRLARLVLRLDGTASIPRIAAEEKVPREEVETLVDDLLAYGLLEQGPTSAIDQYLASATQWRPENDDAVPPVVVLAEDELEAHAVEGLTAVLGDGKVTAVPADHPLRALLGAADTSWLTDSLATEERLAPFAEWSGSVLLALSTVVDPVRDQVLNRACLRHRIPWVHATVDGPFLLVGPAVLPGTSACFECLETRVLMNLRDGASYQRYKNALAAQQVRRGSASMLLPLARLLASHAVLETLNLALTGTTTTVGKLMAVHVPTMEISIPDVLRVPGCPGCGARPESQGQVLYYEPLAGVTAAAP